MRNIFIVVGLVTIAIAMAVVYFERKLREQNHKIATMFSLVSSLADEINCKNIQKPVTNLIDVSDDELEEDELEEEEEQDEEQDEEELEFDFNNDTKVIQLEEMSDLDDDILDGDEDDVSLVSLDDKKTISLEETVDYKKMAVAALREVVSAKGLSSDVAKMKKADLLKLLE
jgi:hypothetical protein